MKKHFMLPLVALFFGAKSMFAVVDPANLAVSTFAKNNELGTLPTELSKMPLDQFMSLTPAKYRSTTGKNLGWRNSLVLKSAQKSLKKSPGDDGQEFPKGLWIVACLYGFGWLCMGLRDDWRGNNWWINLILFWALCFLPGIIHGLIKMREYK